VKEVTEEERPDVLIRQDKSGCLRLNSRLPKVGRKISALKKNLPEKKKVEFGRDFF